MLNTWQVEITVLKLHLTAQQQKKFSSEKGRQPFPIIPFNEGVFF